MSGSRSVQRARRTRGSRPRAAGGPPPTGVAAPSTGLLCRSAAQADRVDAVSLVGGRVVALAGEQVTEVGTAVRAADLGADHPRRAVLDVLDPVLGERGEERRPPAAAVELLPAGEQRGSAGAAGEHALGAVVGVLAREGTLRGSLPQDGVLLRLQPLAPLRLGQPDRVFAIRRHQAVRHHSPGGVFRCTLRVSGKRSGHARRVPVRRVSRRDVPNKGIRHGSSDGGYVEYHDSASELIITRE